LKEDKLLLIEDIIYGEPSQEQDKEVTEEWFQVPDANQQRAQDNQQQTPGRTLGECQKSFQK
jgi:hypothetical protein